MIEKQREIESTSMIEKQREIEKGKRRNILLQ